jgi:hypothetical protein
VGEITKPDTEIYGSQRTFNPKRVIADKAGNVYVVLNNITTGAAMFSPDGEFTGFYGANRVQPTAEIISNYVSGIFMSEEKRARRTRNVPSGITSFDIEGDFIYTCTSSSTQTTDTVKKLNSAGKNIFADNENIFGDYSPMYDTSQNRVLASAIVDIDIETAKRTADEIAGATKYTIVPAADVLILSFLSLFSILWSLRTFQKSDIDR